MLRKRLVRVALLVAPVVIAGAIVYARAAQEPSGVIPQPAIWVPFSADSVWVDETGTARYERVFRSSDGSTRWEGYSSADRNEIVSIAIQNVPKVQYLVWRKKTGWTSQPMQLPPGGWAPRPRRASSVQARGEVVEGFEVVRTEAGDSTSGFTLLHAPALNMFTVYQEIRNCDNMGAVCTTRVSNIQIGEQPAELFEPAADAHIVPLEQPGGIVRGQPTGR